MTSAAAFNPSLELQVQKYALDTVSGVVKTHIKDESLTLLVMGYIGDDRETAVAASLGRRRGLWKALSNNANAPFLLEHTLAMHAHRQTFMGFLWDAELGGNRISLMGVLHARMTPLAGRDPASEPYQGSIHPEVMKRFDQATTLCLEGARPITQETVFKVTETANLVGGHDFALNLLAFHRKKPVKTLFSEEHAKEYHKISKTDKEVFYQTMDAGMWGNLKQLTEIFNTLDEVQLSFFEKSNLDIFPPLLEMLKQGEKVFAAVGSFHFVKGLQYLIDHGVKVTRVPMRPIV